MNKKSLWWIIAAIIVIVIVVVAVVHNNAKKSSTNQAANNKPVQPTSTDPFIPSRSMKVTSTDFTENGAIPSKFTCDGQGTNPEISISGVPSQAKSLVLILHDPDAPGSDGFTHWVMFNIAPGTKQIAENSVPKGAVQGTNGAGQQKYVGMCPPSGTHHYHFKVYALNAPLVLAPTATKGTVEQAMIGHVLDDADLVGTYQKASK